MREGIGGASNKSALYGHSLLALGALSGRTSESGSLEFLLEEEERAEDVEALVLWLAALGNSGSPSILPQLRPYLDHEVADVRERAVSALRHIHNTTVDEALRRACLDDQDARVRGAAAEILAARTSELSNETAAFLLERDTHRGVRRRAIQGLARRAPRDARAFQLLGNVYSSDPDASLRELARTCLYG